MLGDETEIVARKHQKANPKDCQPDMAYNLTDPPSHIKHGGGTGTVTRTGAIQGTKSVSTAGGAYTGDRCSFESCFTANNKLWGNKTWD